MFRYSLTQDDYLEMISHTMRERTNLMARLGSALLTVVGAAGVALWVVLRTNTSRTIKLLLCAFAAGIFFYKLYTVFCIRPQAKAALERINKNGQLNRDIWREHTLWQKDGVIHCSFGTVHLEESAAAVDVIDSSENLSLIKIGGNVFDMVPKKTVDLETLQAFIEQAQAEAFSADRSQLAQQREEDLSTASFAEHVVIDPGMLAGKMVAMKRQSYFSKCAQNGLSLYAPLLEIALAVYFAVSAKYGLALLLLAMAIFLNMPLIRTFLPVCRSEMRREIVPAENNDYLLTVNSGEIRVYAQNKRLSFNAADMLGSVRKGENLYVYFAKGQMLYVPGEYAERFLAAL